MTEANAYPLAWPQGWPRTKHPAKSRFSVTPDKAQQELRWEIERLGGRYPVVSSNVPTRRDGMIYATARPDNNDHGVAVYFERNGKQMVFACDRWDRIQDNLRAIQKTIEAMRGVERWGASDMMERAFSAFEALPSPQTAWQVLGVSKGASSDDINAAYRRKAMESHPDTGGSTDAMAALNEARRVALAEVA